MICSPGAASLAPCHSERRGGHGSRPRRHGPTTRGLIFANLVDFDTVYGHRNDVAGYAANLERFDERLGAVLRGCDDDLLVITADHGNDPTTPSTDHSREYVPLLLSGERVRARATERRHALRPLPISARRSPRNFGVGAARQRDELSGGHRCRPFVKRSKQREREMLAPQAAKSADSRGRLRPETRRRRASGVSARSRSHHSQQGLPAAQAQDAGLPGAGRRSLPHPADAHPRGVADRPHDRQGAAAPRRADRSDRPRARPRPHAVRPRRRAGARLADAGRIPPLRAESADRGRPRERRPRPESHLRGARRHRPALEGQGRIAGRRRAAKRAATLEGQIMRVADLIAYVNHDIDDAVRAGVLEEQALPPRRGRHARCVLVGAHRPDGEGRRHRDDRRRRCPRSG